MIAKTNKLKNQLEGKIMAYYITHKNSFTGEQALQGYEHADLDGFSPEHIKQLKSALHRIIQIEEKLDLRLEEKKELWIAGQRELIYNLEQQTLNINRHLDILLDNKKEGASPEAIREQTDRYINQISNLDNALYEARDELRDQEECTAQELFNQKNRWVTRQAYTTVFSMSTEELNKMIAVLQKVKEHMSTYRQYDYTIAEDQGFISAYRQVQFALACEREAEKIRLAASRVLAMSLFGDPHLLPVFRSMVTTNSAEQVIKQHNAMVMTNSGNPMEYAYRAHLTQCRQDLTMSALFLAKEHNQRFNRQANDHYIMPSMHTPKLYSAQQLAGYLILKAVIATLTVFTVLASPSFKKWGTQNAAKQRIQKVKATRHAQFKQLSKGLESTAGVINTQSDRFFNHQAPKRRSKSLGVANNTSCLSARQQRYQTHAKSL